MPLTDPELDLLLEMLTEDPAAEVFVQVGEELVRRGRWADAVNVLWTGLGQGAPMARAYELLARAALEAGQYEVAHLALVEVDRDPTSNPELARVEILVLERSGRLDAARTHAEKFLAHDPHDVVVSTVLERLQAPPPKPRERAADPFYTVARAERYVDLGRADRAVRVYRRIMLANPGSPPIELRMRQLMTAPADIADDLSSELTDPGLVPELPDANPGPLDMPPSTLTPGPAPTRLTPGPSPGRGSGGPGRDKTPSPRSTRPPAPSRPPAAPANPEGPTNVPAPGRHHQPLPPPPAIDDEENTERVDVFAALKRYAEGRAHTDGDSDSSDEADYERLHDALDPDDPDRRKKRSLLRR